MAAEMGERDRWRWVDGGGQTVGGVRRQRILSEC